jgi:hypothetical protein
MSNRSIQHTHTQNPVRSQRHLCLASHHLASPPDQGQRTQTDALDVERKIYISHINKISVQTELGQAK